MREKRQSNAEVDFLFQYKDHLIPIEVKAGKVGRLASLFQFIKRSQQRVAVRLYAGPMRLDRVDYNLAPPFKLLSLPYFLAHKLPEYLDLLFESPEMLAQ